LSVGLELDFWEIPRQTEAARATTRVAWGQRGVSHLRRLERATAYSPSSSIWRLDLAEDAGRATIFAVNFPPCSPEMARIGLAVRHSDAAVVYGQQRPFPISSARSHSMGERTPDNSARRHPGPFRGASHFTSSHPPIIRGRSLPSSCWMPSDLGKPSSPVGANAAILVAKAAPLSHHFTHWQQLRAKLALNHLFPHSP